jgi:hypothetical protein
MRSEKGSTLEDSQEVLAEKGPSTGSDKQAPTYLVGQPFLASGHIHPHPASSELEQKHSTTTPSSQRTRWPQDSLFPPLCQATPNRGLP